MSTPEEDPPRRASLLLVTPDGTPVGRLPEVEVAIPWWPDATAVVEAVREAFDLDVVLLRMLDSERQRPHGGGMTYLAEVAAPIARSPRAAEALLPFDVELDEQPLRLRWAKPGGPDADLRWAEEVLLARRIERDGPAEQVRSWNLSSIWRLPLAGGGPAWLKVVPPFFAHEGDMLRRLQGDAVPRLLGHDGDRVLLADIGGEDQYDAVEPELLDDGVDAGRPPGLVDRARRRAPAHRPARLARPGAHGPHRRHRPTPFRGPRARGSRRRSRPSSPGSRPGSRPSTPAASPTRSSTATTTRATSAARPAT